MIVARTVNPLAPFIVMMRRIHTWTLVRVQRLPIGRHLPDQLVQLVNAHAYEPRERWTNNFSVFHLSTIRSGSGKSPVPGFCSKTEIENE